MSAARLPLLASLALTSCFVDSRWLGAGRQQARQEATKRRLEPARTDTHPQGTRLVRSRQVRRVTLVVYATPRYVAQGVDWQVRFRSDAEAASRILERDVRLALDVRFGGLWEQQEDDLGQALLALQARHPAAPGELVVGLVSARALLPTPFRRLGVARRYGRHLVVRGANDALEFDAIERALPKLSAAERSGLYAQRRRHRAAVVLAHEIGHCLGAGHSAAGRDIMGSSYSTSHARFAPSSVAQMAPEIARRYGSSSPSERAQPAVAPRWQPQVPVPAASPPAASALPSPPPASPPEPPPGLSGATDAASESGMGSAWTEQDAERLTLARRLSAAGRLDEAATVAAPLFAGHAEVAAVAELRCHLATQQSRPWEETQAACRAFLELRRQQAERLQR